MILKVFLFKKMDPVKELALGLLEDLKPIDFKKIKSHIGLIELACDIVEETQYRLKISQLKISSEYKKELAITLAHYILAKILDANLINIKAAEEMENLLREDNIELVSNLIDDIICIWHDAKIITLRFCPCLSSKRSRTIRKFEHLKVKNHITPSVTNV